MLYGRFALWWYSAGYGTIVRLFVALSIRTVVAILSAAYMVAEILSPPLSKREGRVSLGAWPRKGRTLQSMKVTIPLRRLSPRHTADTPYKVGSTGVWPREDTISCLCTRLTV